MGRPRKEKEKDGKRVQQVPLSPEEDACLERLRCRYQEAVVAQNKKLSEKDRRSANVELTEIMRAGLVALEQMTPEEVRVAVLAVIDEKKVKAAHR